MKFKLRHEKVERQFLTERGLGLIEKTTFKDAAVERVKDLFIFACYTGLSYVDVQQLKAEHLVKGIGGNDWLYNKRIKNDEPLRIPLLPRAVESIGKYTNERSLAEKGRLLPIYSNQMMNHTFKDIAKACGIRKKMTFHTARHTFATSITLSNLIV